MNIFISIIITTKNEAKNIVSCLESVKKQTYPQNQLEIIVVDNNSTDNTKELAKKYTDKVFDKGPERSAQRNFGVQQSKGEYFLYLDADMILHPDVIQECVGTIQNSKFKIQNFNLLALYIPEIIMGTSFWCKVRRFERSFYDATCIDCVRFIQKEAFLNVGGFDEAMSGPEDWDLDRKIRQIGKVALIKNPVYHNEAEFNLKKYLNKKGYYAQSFDKYINKWGKDDGEVKKQLGFYYRFIGVFIENGKWKKLVLHPILISGMYWLRIMVGVKFLLRNNLKNNV
jgi:glycosyltransferase involved in cell wall biosynthesis